MIDFKNIIDKLPNVVFIADPVTYETLYINQIIHDVYGYTREQCLNNPKTWWNSIHADDKERVSRDITNIVNSGQARDVNYRIHNSERDIRWIRNRIIPHTGENGKIEYIFGLLCDITEHKEQLEDAQINLNELLEESSTIIYRCEPSGKFPATFISNNVTSQLGYSPEQFTQDQNFWAEHIHPEDFDSVFEDLGQLFEKGYHSHEYRFLNSGGEYVWMRDDLRLICNEDGDYQSIVGNWTDITKIKELEKLEHENRQMLEHANRMQALGTLIGGVAHEFNNMLGVVIGYGGLLSQISGLNENSQKYINHILTASNRSKNLVQQLLSFSRKNIKKIELVNLCDEVKNEINFIKNTIPSSIDINVIVNCDCQLVMMDLGELRQVMINLVSNSVYAMQSKGEINISIEEVTVDNENNDENQLFDDGVYIKVSVTDNGSGISKGEFQRIFEPFYTTKPVGEGTGMGLALVYSMLKSYGGGVRVYSELGRYTTFELYFPVAEQDVMPVLKNIDIDPVVRVSGLKILYVDDEKLYTEMVCEILTRAGHQVTSFTCGNKALEHFKSNPYAYDLLITDQIMPEILGIELGEAVLEIRRDMDIIICTGYGAGVDKNIMLNRGIKSVIYKPFTSSVLENEIYKITSKNTCCN